MTVAYNDYEKGLNARSFFKVHDSALSESLVQDTFSKTWAYLAKGGKILLMKAFLYHILNDLIIDEYRKKKSISLDVLIEKGFEINTGDTKKLFDILDGKVAFLLIEKLPVKYRKIMNMRYLQDLTILEMATITGQTKNSLTVQLHRGLEKLKVLYNHA